MILQFENFTGKVDIKVYDMTGNLMDNFQIYNGMNSNTMSYDMKGYSDGIYFFVVTGRDGVVTKKVIVYDK